MIHLLRRARLLLIVGLFTSTSWGRVAACPACLGPEGPRLTAVQKLIDCDQVVLAHLTPDPLSFRIDQVLKGDATPGQLLTLRISEVPQFPPDETRLILLGHSALSKQWRPLGDLGEGQDEWLKRVIATKRTLEFTEADWETHVAFHWRHRNHEDPWIRQTADEELGRSPYLAMRSLQPRLAAKILLEQLTDDDNRDRRSLLVLLLGIAGGDDAQSWIDDQLAQSSRRQETLGLAAMLVAKLEMERATGIDWIDQNYLSDPKRKRTERGAAVMALGIQGTANPDVFRPRVIAIYRELLETRSEFAGLIAADLTEWCCWDFATELQRCRELSPLDEPTTLSISRYLEARQRLLSDTD